MKNLTLSEKINIAETVAGIANKSILIEYVLRVVITKNYMSKDILSELGDVDDLSISDFYEKIGLDDFQIIETILNKEDYCDVLNLCKEAYSDLNSMVPDMDAIQEMIDGFKKIGDLNGNKNSKQ